MAGYIPYAYRSVLLSGLAGKTALPTGTLYLGLATSVGNSPLEASLATITEVTTAGYARAAVPTFGVATTTSPVRITVPTDFSFPSVTTDMTTPAAYAFLTDASSGTGGQLRYIFELSPALQAKAGDPIVVPANSLIIE